MTTHEREDEKGIESLIERLDDAESDLVLRAGEDLARIGLPAVPALIRALDCREPRIIEGATWTLGRIGPPAREAVPALTKTLLSSHEWTRGNAAWALGEIGEAAVPVIKTLVSVLTDTNTVVRIKAAWALGKLGKSDHGAMRGLVRAAGDNDAVVRAIAAWSLMRISTSAGQPLPVPAVGVDQFIEAIHRDAQAAAPSYAARALGKIGRNASGAVPALIEALLDTGRGDPHLRRAACIALEEIGLAARDALDQIIPALTAAQEDTSIPRLRLLAALALEKLRPARQEATPRLFSRVTVALPRGPRPQPCKRNPLELPLSLIAILDAYLEWPEDYISQREFANSSILKEKRKQLGLYEPPVLSTVVKHLGSIAAECGVGTLLDTPREGLGSRVRPELKAQLMKLRQDLQLSVREQSGQG